MTEEEQRALIVKTALTYERTPYHHKGMVKGAGVDCLTLLERTFYDCGLIVNAEIPYYPQDFMQHRSEERYIAGLLQYTREVDAPQPGDIAIWKFGRCFSHAAIVIEWPLVIHACVDGGVRREDVEKAEWLRLMKDGKTARPVRFFSYWGAE